MRRDGFLLALLTLLLNANALGAFFVGDDYDFLRLARRMDGFADAWRFQFWGEWEPTWYLTWYADWRIWGFHPLGFHLTNVLWLAAAVLALYGLVRVLWPAAPGAAWAAALLFATNPLHDEAVTYLAARGHVVCLALALAALVLYARGRRVASRAGLLAGAALVALAAALAKEIALLLPLWIGCVEWLVLDGERPRHRALARGLAAGAAFVVPAAASLLLRQLTVGLGSRKLAGLGGNWLELWKDAREDLPVYSLLGALPVPFGFLTYPTVERWKALGWFVLLLATVTGAAAFALAALRRRRSPAAGFVALGLAIVVTGLVPVFWADLPLRRRYLFVSSAGIALVAAVGFEWLQSRRPRAAAVLLALAAVLGGAGTLYRNELWRRAGHVAQNLIETTRGAPIAVPVQWPNGPPVIALVTLPSRYGGDFLSGAYLFHHTDLKSAFEIFGIEQHGIQFAMSVEHADDHRTELLSASPTELRLRLSFRTGRAFAAARAEDPAENGMGGLLVASRVAEEPQARTLDYVVRVSPGLSRASVFLYSDEAFRRLTPP